jgi:hypothetical protein
MGKNRKMGDLSNFETGQIVGVHLAGASMTKTATLLGVSRTTVSWLCRHTQIMVRQRRRRGTVGENQHWQKRASYIGDCFGKSQNCCHTGDSRTEYHLEGPVSAKTIQHELHKSNIHGRASIVKPVFTESNAQMRKQLCLVTTIIPGHQTTGNARDMVRCVVLRAVPYFKMRLCMENIQGSLWSGMPGSNSGTQGRSCDMPTKGVASFKIDIWFISFKEEYDLSAVRSTGWS